MLIWQTAGGPTSLAGPLRALANSIGGDVSKLNTRAVLADGQLRSAEAPSVAPPVWFVFTGARTTSRLSILELLLARPQCDYQWASRLFLVQYAIQHDTWRSLCSSENRSTAETYHTRFQPTE